MTKPFLLVLAVARDRYREHNCPRRNRCIATRYRWGGPLSGPPLIASLHRISLKLVEQTPDIVSVLVEVFQVFDLVAKNPSPPIGRVRMEEADHVVVHREMVVWQVGERPTSGPPLGRVVMYGHVHLVLLDRAAATAGLGLAIVGFARAMKTGLSRWERAHAVPSICAESREYLNIDESREEKQHRSYAGCQLLHLRHQGLQHVVRGLGLPLDDVP